MSTTRTTSYARASDGAYVGYQTMGAGPVDVVISSYGTVSIDSFDELPQLAHFLDSLASFARVILFDWRGVGLSDPLPANAEPGVAHGTDDVLAVLDATGTRPSLLAWLNTGPTMVMLAARHPERVRSLILANTIAKLEQAPGYECGVPSEVVRSFATDVIDPSGAGDNGRVISIHAPSMAGDATFERWWDDGGRRGASPGTAQRIMQQLIAADVRHVLPSVRVPTLVLHGRDVQWYRVGHGRFLAEHIPGAQLVELDSADMAIFTDSAESALEEIEEFLTGERHSHEPPRELMTVVFTDVVDSTRQLSEMGDRRWREVLDELDRLADREVRRCRGRVVKTTGDGMLAVFDSPARALRCVTALTAKAAVPLRAGVHTGEVELRGSDIGGFAVHVGQRVCAAASAGETLVSRTVADLVAGSGFMFVDRGEHDFKGLDGRWQLYAVK